MYTLRYTVQRTDLPKFNALKDAISEQNAITQAIRLASTLNSDGTVKYSGFSLYDKNDNFVKTIIV